jgi:hypothetical protein
LLSLLGTREKYFSFHFKHYNLTICAVNVFETFCTCSLSSLGQDLIVKIAIFILFIFSFGLLELDRANLRCFFEKNDLHPLGVKFKMKDYISNQCPYFIYWVLYIQDIDPKLWIELQ